MEARVTRLEDQFKNIETLLRDIDKSVRKLESDAGELKGRVANLPTAMDMGELKGRIATLPSTWQMITIVLGGQVTLAGLLFAALKLGGVH